MKKLIILPTIECNIQCGHCGQAEDIKHMTMDDSLLEKLLNEVKEQDIPMVKISGGEVTSLKYKKRLLSALNNTEVGKDRNLMVETSAWFAVNLDYARKVVRELEEAHVSNLLISTDSYHAKFVPINNIANVIKAIEGTSVRINSINVRSFPSSFEHDVNLILELSRLASQPISRTQAYSFTPEGAYTSRSINGFFDFKRDWN